GRLGGAAVQFRDVLALLGGGLPAGRLIALHFVGDALIGDGDGAHLGPDRVAVGMVAMVVRVEDELDGLGGDLLGVIDHFARTAGEIGVDDDEVILHLDDGVVAVALVLDVAFAEPDAGGDLFDGVGLGIAAG